jgi:CRP-like cAMP-binding protein
MLNPLILLATDGLKKYVRTIRPALWETYGKQRREALERELQKTRAQLQERERQHHLRMQELIETFPLFAEVDEDSQEELLLLFRPRSASPGERVIRRGDRGDGMFFISSGAVEVRLASGAVRLEPGAFFGEMALLSGGRRSADVTAVDFCQFQVLERRDFNMFMSRHPNLRAAVSDMARQRTEMNVMRQQREKLATDDQPAGQ